MSDRQTSQGYTYSRTAYVWAEFLLGQFARTVTVFFRYDFGERYFNVADVLGSSFTFFLTGSAIAVIGEALKDSGKKATSNAGLLDKVVQTAKGAAGIYKRCNDFRAKSRQRCFAFVLYLFSLNERDAPALGVGFKKETQASGTAAMTAHPSSAQCCRKPRTYILKEKSAFPSIYPSGILCSDSSSRRLLFVSERQHFTSTRR